jgi:zinc and cadmium transporter
MAVFAATLLSVICVSLISLVGLATLSLSTERMHRLTHHLVGFAAGVLLGTSFFHIIPEIAEQEDDLLVSNPFVWILVGVILSFLLERFIHWHHCDKETCTVRPAGYVNLWGDALHNFADGIIIAAAYLTDLRLGFITTIAVLFHEIPQELGDFAVLLHSGFGRTKALRYNFISATAAIAGALIAFVALPIVHTMTPVVVAIAGGSFLYIALADLMPEMHRGCNIKKDIIQTVLIFVGISITALLTNLLDIG